MDACPRGRVARALGAQRGEAQGAPTTPHGVRARAAAAAFSDEVAAEIADALNVKELEHVTDLEGLLDYTVVPNFRALGPKVGHSGTPR